MGLSGLYSYGCSKCVDDTISLVEGIPMLESMATCPWPRWTLKLKDISCGWPEYGWALPGLLAQDTICMNDYISGSQPRIRKELVNAHLYKDPTTTPDHGSDDNIYNSFPILYSHNYIRYTHSIVTKLKIIKIYK